MLCRGWQRRWTAKSAVEAGERTVAEALDDPEDVGLQPLAERYCLHAMHQLLCKSRLWRERSQSDSQGLRALHVFSGKLTMALRLLRELRATPGVETDARNLDLHMHAETKPCFKLPCQEQFWSSQS